MNRDHMEIINETVINRFGIAIRLIKDSGTYQVLQSPLQKDGSYDEKAFTLFGGSVGYESSEFDNQDDAQQFFNDIQLLDNEKLTERYPDLWVKY